MTIFLVSLFLVLPQIINHSLVLGGDSLFHFNRIYDTYMQFKTGNFSYFQTNYGFLQSGRIINALYGPGFAYLLGILLLIVHNWILFQIVTSFLIFFISGYSMYFLSRELQSSKKISLLIASLFMGSFYVTRWSINQNFMSWGVMLMPLIVILGLKMIKNNAKDLKVLPLALLISALIQIHVLSALMSVGVIFIFFVVGFYKTNQKLQLLSKCFLAALLTIALTFNVWGAMLEIFTRNTLYSPYTHLDMASDTMRISTGSYSASSIGLVMSVIFILQFILLFSRWSQVSLSNRLITLLGILFLLLSTNLVPWTTISNLIPQLRSFLQFPYRFYGFATVLLLAGFGISLSELPSFKLKKTGELFLIISIFFILGQAYIDIQQQNKLWNSNDPLIYKGSVVVSNYLTSDQIRTNFTSSNLSKGLKVVKKIAPDYLPNNRDEKTTYNKKEYKKDIVRNRPNITKAVTKNGDLILKWHATKKGESIALPIVVYNNSEFTLNGSRLHRLSLSALGVPTVKTTKKGINHVALRYQSEVITKNNLFFVITTWILSLFTFIILKFNTHNKKNK